MVTWASLATVLAILLSAYLFSDRPHTEPGVMGAADRARDGLVLPAVESTPSTSPRGLSSREEWLALLPRLQDEVSRHPEDDTARRRLALALYNLDRLDEAQALYEALLAENEDAVVRNRLGNVLRERGDLVGAESAYRIALQHDPALPAPYLNLAELLWRLRRTDEALDLLARGTAAVTPEARPVLERAAAAIRAGAGPSEGE